jgi:hypothetical protein
MIGKLWGWLFSQPEKIKIAEPVPLAPETAVTLPEPIPPVEPPSAPAEEIKNTVVKNTRPKRGGKKPATKKSK